MASESNANPKERLTGDYQLRGVMETASSLRLNADGTYKYGFMFGSVDEFDEGNWRIENGEVLLNSTVSDIAPSFVFVRSSVESRPGARVLFEGPDAQKVAALVEIRFDANGRSTRAASVGMNSFESHNTVPPIDKISISFMGVLRSYPVQEHRPGDPSHNQFIFRSNLGNFGFVRFKELRLKVDANDLIMNAPGFKREFRYARINFDATPMSVAQDADRTAPWRASDRILVRLCFDGMDDNSIRRLHGQLISSSSIGSSSLDLVGLTLTKRPVYQGVLEHPVRFRSLLVELPGTTVLAKIDAPSDLYKHIDIWRDTPISLCTREEGAKYKVLRGAPLEQMSCPDLGIHVSMKVTTDSEHSLDMVNVKTHGLRTFNGLRGCREFVYGKNK